MPNAILRVGPYASSFGNFVDPELEVFTAPVNCNKVNWVNDNWQAKSFAQWSFSDPGVPVNVPPGTVYDEDTGQLTAFGLVGLGQTASYDDWGDPFNGSGPELILEFYYQAAQQTTVTLSWSFLDNVTDPITISYFVITTEGTSDSDSITPVQNPGVKSGTLTVNLLATTLGRVRAIMAGPGQTDNINGNNWSLKFS